MICLHINVPNRFCPSQPLSTFPTFSRGPITVSALADLMEEKPVGLIKYLMTDLGIMAGMTQTLDQPTCAAVVKGFGKIVFGSEEDNEDE